MLLRRLLPPAGVWPVLMAALAAAPAVRADTLSLRVEVYGPMGIHVVTNRNDIEESGGRYSIRSFLSTRGLASMIVDITNHSEARGRLAGDGVKPEMFRSHTERNGTERRDYVDYHPDGRITGGAAPPNAGEIVPVAATQTPGTVDNLSAYFLIERHLAQTGNCNLTIPVYEGRHRYNLRFTDRGETVLAPAGGQRYSGNAHVCHMQRQEIAGFPRDGHSEGAREGDIWYGKLAPGDLAMPIRLELDTEIGRVEGYLAELHGRGVDLKLMD